MAIGYPKPTKKEKDKITADEFRRKYSKNSKGSNRYNIEYLNHVRKKKKYRNNSATFNGRRFDSVKEARYAEELEWRVQSGDIQEYICQPYFELIVNGVKVAGIRPDFQVIKNDGSIEIHEVKSKATMTDVWKVKWTLLQALQHEIFDDLVEFKVII